MPLFTNVFARWFWLLCLLGASHTVLHAASHSGRGLMDLEVLKQAILASLPEVHAQEHIPGFNGSIMHALFVSA